MGWVGNVWYGADIWLDAELRWDELAQSLDAGDYCEAYFEQLVASPASELAKICNFLGIDFDERMLSYPDSSTYYAPDARLANQWKQKLSPAEIHYVEAKCGSAEWSHAAIPVRALASTLRCRHGRFLGCKTTMPVRCSTFALRHGTIHEVGRLPNG